MKNDRLEFLLNRKEDYEEVLKDTKAKLALKGVSCGVSASLAITIIMELAANLSRLEDTTKALLLFMGFVTSSLNALNGYEAIDKLEEKRQIKNKLDSITKDIGKEEGKVLKR